MSTHELKTWPEFFAVIESGEKTFEVRKDDRGFHAGDHLLLREWLPRDNHYTGRSILVEVTYLLTDPLFGIARGYVCMAIKRHRTPMDWTAMKCRFGCADPVVGIYHAPQGCICWPDPVQALCAQHAVKGLQNNDGMSVLIKRPLPDKR